MVPMSVRAEAERGALGNRVTTMYAPLPVGVADPRERFDIVHAAMTGLKESGQAVGAEVLTQLAGFAPPTVLSQAARLQTRQRLFNLTVTNVPGPQFPLYMLGSRLRRSTRRCRCRATRRWASRSCPTTGRWLRPAGRLRRAAGPRGHRRRAARRDRRAGAAARAASRRRPRARAKRLRAGRRSGCWSS